MNSSDSSSLFVGLPALEAEPGAHLNHPAAAAAVINLIGGTRTRTGLKVKAVLDTNQFETGVAISDEDIDQLRLKRHKLHPDWNYTLLPRA